MSALDPVRTETRRTDLALHGGRPVRSELLPYGRQWVDEEDIAAVTGVLKSDWLTTGPAVDGFEADLADLAGVQFAVAVSNGTAALHCAMAALGVGPGDEVLVPTLTFVASANAVVFQGGTPVLVDVDPDTLLIDPAEVEARLTERTRAIVAVDFAGQPCDYQALREIAEPRGISLVADASHALGAFEGDRPVGSLADLSVFSFHPVKHVTTGEGGAVTTADAELARRVRLFRGHGITTDHRQRTERDDWRYEMVQIGHNYRISDIQCALGRSQLDKLDSWVRRRGEIAAAYDRTFARLEGVRPLSLRPSVRHAYHLYVVRFERDAFTVDRDAIFRALRAEGIGVNVHYMPVHLHPFYRERFGTGPGLCPAAERVFEEIVSLPVFPRMSDGDVEDVMSAVSKVAAAYAR